MVKYWSRPFDTPYGSGKMVPITVTGKALWDKVEASMEKVQRRLRRAVGILIRAGVPYAVVGGNAVRVWVAQVDETAVRATQDVDILISREHLGKVIEAMSAEGLTFRESAGLSMLLESPDDKARDAIHLVFTGERIKADDPEENPEIEPVVQVEDFQTLPLERLVRMKLNSHRLKDRVHLLDMISVGLVDSNWPEKYPPVLAGRLRALLENPDQ